MSMTDFFQGCHAILRDGSRVTVVSFQGTVTTTDGQVVQADDVIGIIGVARSLLRAALGPVVTVDLPDGGTQYIYNTDGGGGTDGTDWH